MNTQTIKTVIQILITILTALLPILSKEDVAKLKDLILTLKNKANVSQK